MALSSLHGSSEMRRSFATARTRTSELLGCMLRDRIVTNPGSPALAPRTSQHDHQIFRAGKSAKTLGGATNISQALGCARPLNTFSLCHVRSLVERRFRVSPDGQCTAELGMLTMIFNCLQL